MLAYVHFDVQQDPQVWPVVLVSLFSVPGAFEVITAHVPGFPLPCVKLCEGPASPFVLPLRVPWADITTSQYISQSPGCGISKLTEITLGSIM